MRFYLGAHHPHWLATAGVPLFVSRTRLAGRVTMPVARAHWALDSGGFTELSKFGEWTFSAREYVSMVHRCFWEVGSMDWAAPQDWMCEPWIIKKTGLSVEEHQRRTVENFISLISLGGRRLFIPVLQGWDLGDYLRCIEMYRKEGIDLRLEPVVGLGSVCRRQSTADAAAIVRAVSAEGINLHGFGFKTLGLAAVGHLLHSADSMAWSFTARRQPVLMDGHQHANCANCMEWALTWREGVLAKASGVAA